MMMKNARLLLYVLLLFSVAACSDYDGTGDMDMVEMPVYIAIPAAGFSSPEDVGLDGQSAENRDTRAAVGDPGSDEDFELPHYIYMYMVATNDGESSVTYTKFSVSRSDWKLSTSDENSNDHFTARDGLYVYQGHLSMYLPAKRQQGKVYVAASNADLELHGLVTKDLTPATVAEQVTFNCSQALAAEMKNLYSTPYNLKNEDGEYYGTVKDFSGNVPHLDIVLYHTATKVDVQWQIDEDCQGVKEWQETNTTDMSADADRDKVFFSGIEAYNLPERCPLFMPMNCTDGTKTFSVPLHDKDEGYKGQRYNGRSVIYVIPRRYAASGDYFVDLRMQVNNYTAADPTLGHHAYIQIRDESLTQAEGSPTHTPWLRAFVHVTKDNVGNLVTLNDKKEHY